MKFTLILSQWLRNSGDAPQFISQMAAGGVGAQTIEGHVFMCIGNMAIRGCASAFNDNILWGDLIRINDEYHETDAEKIELARNAFAKRGVTFDVVR